MSPTAEFFYYALWCAHPVLQLAVVAIMLRRKLHKTFPVFFTYALAQVVIFALLFPFRSNYSTFFNLYWGTAAVSLGLGFWVIYELFLDVFRPYHTLKDLGAVLFKWAGLVMLMAAGVVAAASPVSQDPLSEAIVTSQRCVRVIQCGLVLFLLLFSHYLGVSRKQKSFGIALGFGAFAGVELLIVALDVAGRVNVFASAIANMIAYNLSILVWLGYMWSKEEARESSATLLMSQRWDQSFMDLQHPMPADSLIPMFENMVEQAISRVHDDPPAEMPEGQPEVREQTLDDLVNSYLTPASAASAERAKSATASGDGSSSEV